MGAGTEPDCELVRHAPGLFAHVGLRLQLIALAAKLNQAACQEAQLQGPAVGRGVPMHAASALGRIGHLLHAYLLTVFHDDVRVNFHHFGRYLLIAGY
jgi:hypothetical protein